MFYLAKITADDRIARNFDFETIWFERFREKISAVFNFYDDGPFNNKLFSYNRYPLYFGPEVRIQKRSLEYLANHYHSVEILVRRHVFNCILEMVKNGYFDKTNIASTNKLSEKDKLLYARYILSSVETARSSSRMYVQKDSRHVFGSGWHIHKNEYLWLVSLGPVSTFYDTRYRISKFSDPKSKDIKTFPTFRVVGMHGSIMHKSPAKFFPSEFVKEKKRSEVKRIFAVYSWTYQGKDRPWSFKEWVKYRYGYLRTWGVQ